MVLSLSGNIGNQPAVISQKKQLGRVQGIVWKAFQLLSEGNHS